jgi:hypothetical protein
MSLQPSGGRLSDLFPVNVGIPQGSVLGSLLFSLFTDYICRAVLTSNYHLYADDFQVYTGGRLCDISDCIYRLNVDLEAIFHWSVENGLSLNSEKTQAMIICRDKGRMPALLPAVPIDGRTLPHIE